MTVIQNAPASAAGSTDDIVRREIDVWADGIGRLEQELSNEARKRATAQAKLQKLEQLRAEFERDASSSAARMRALKRIIAQRRRALVDLEHEIG